MPKRFIRNMQHRARVHVCVRACHMHHSLPQTYVYAHMLVHLFSHVFAYKYIHAQAAWLSFPHKKMRGNLK
jgi:hypothetical protein